uniref:Uncharacterized protein n=1 Tax=Arundo donax TaxID=35708 RepID=A0A0A9G407_ARUDO
MARASDCYSDGRQGRE